jgi:signal transduction histidine kinase
MVERGDSGGRGLNESSIEGTASRSASHRERRDTVPSNELPPLVQTEVADPTERTSCPTAPELTEVEHGSLARRASIDRERDEVPWTPRSLLLIATAAIFVVEALVMLLFVGSGLEPSLLIAFVDASVLTALLFPILYLVLLRPLTRTLHRQQRVEADLRQSIETQLSLHRVTSPAIDDLDSYSLLEAVVDEVLPLVGADAAWVTIPGENGSDLPRVVAHRGVPETFIAAETASPLALCPVCGPLLEHGQAPAGLQLLNECPRLPKDAFASAGLRTHLGALLRTGNGRPAILNIGWHRDRSLSETDRTLLATIVHQVGISLENAQLYRAEQHARLTAQTLRRASLAVAGSLDLDTVIKDLLDHLGELIPYDRARVMLLEGSSRLRVHAMSGGTEVRFIDRQTPSFDVADNPVLRDLMSDRRGTIIDDTHRHPDWGVRMAPGFEHSWIGVPLITGRTALGLYSLSKSEPGFFTDEHLKLAEGLAAPASIAIHNATLFERARRSGELLQTLSHQQVDLQEAERRAISRELHDEAGQVLTTLKVGLRLLERHADRPEEVTSRVGELIDMVDALQDDLHRLAADLRPASLDQLGLVPALRSYVGEIERKHRQTIEFEAVGMDGDRCSMEFEIALFRIAQEAITNSVRHARAEHVSVLLERRDQRIIMVVEDDGVGFDLEEARRENRLGLVGMGERTEMLRGTLLIESGASSGTTVVVEVPCES